MFLALFVHRRGNLREVERALGVSYLTVRATLEEIIAALDQLAPAPRATASRSAILERVARGELSPAEALAPLARVRGAAPRDSDRGSYRWRQASVVSFPRPVRA